jgi:hypothetical protein
VLQERSARLAESTVIHRFVRALVAQIGHAPEIISVNQEVGFLSVIRRLIMPDSEKPVRLVVLKGSYVLTMVLNSIVALLAPYQVLVLRVLVVDQAR